jgi:hypothetical protein
LHALDNGVMTEAAVACRLGVNDHGTLRETPGHDAYAASMRHLQSWIPRVTAFSRVKLSNDAAMDIKGIGGVSAS